MPRPHILLLLLGLTLASCSHTPIPASALPTPVFEPASAPGLRLNQIQLVGTHNSYKQPIPRPLQSLLSLFQPDLATTLDYSHPPLSVQLNQGMRSLELDVYHDPEGGHFAGLRWNQWVKGLNLLFGGDNDPEDRLQQPGFKVMHIQDLDIRSHCLLLTDCLKTLHQWSEQHPQHSPIIITMNLKNEAISWPGFNQPIPLNATALDTLDNDIRHTLGAEKLITPDDVRGNYPTLEAAVRAQQWPLLDSVRGRFLFVLDEGGSTRQQYIEGHPSLRGRVLFTSSEEGQPEAAFRIINRPIAKQENIRTLVQQGYMVRTRADANTHQARTGDTRMRDAAFSSGAQVITTDYFLPENKFGTGYQVQLPGAAPVRCNPVIQPTPCPF